MAPPSGSTVETTPFAPLGAVDRNPDTAGFEARKIEKAKKKLTSQCALSEAYISETDEMRSNYKNISYLKAATQAEPGYLATYYRLRHTQGLTSFSDKQKAFHHYEGAKTERNRAGATADASIRPRSSSDTSSDSSSSSGWESISVSPDGSVNGEPDGEEMRSMPC